MLTEPLIAYAFFKTDEELEEEDYEDGELIKILEENKKKQYLEETCLQRPVYFYNITAISPYRQQGLNEIKYCTVNIGGDVFIINETAESLNERYKEALRKEKLFTTFN